MQYKDRGTRAWCFTLNNYTEENINHFFGVNEESFKYLIFGREVGESGTPHLQGYVAFKNVKTLSAAKLWTKADSIHMEKAMTVKAAIDYCKKDGNWVERGEPPLDPKEFGAREKLRWDVALELAKKGDFSSIEPQIQIQQCRNLQFIHMQHKSRRNLEDVTNEDRNLWIYGDAGTGKSRFARNVIPRFYHKLVNKWWDNYIDEDNVLIEDFDQSHHVLLHHLKLWADRYPFRAETKGSSTLIRPKRIVVTSNWHPALIWPHDKDLQPVLRRFRLIDAAEGFPEELLPKVLEPMELVPDYQEDLKGENLALPPSPYPSGSYPWQDEEDDYQRYCSFGSNIESDAED